MLRRIKLLGGALLLASIGSVYGCYWNIYEVCKNDGDLLGDYTFQPCGAVSKLYCDGNWTLPTTMYVDPPNGRTLQRGVNLFCTGLGKGFNSCTMGMQYGIDAPEFYSSSTATTQVDGNACQ